MATIDRSHYESRQYSLEEIHDKKLHVVFGSSASHSRVYCDEDQAFVTRVTKLALVIDMNHHLEPFRQHLELHFYRSKHRIRETLYGPLPFPGEEVILIPLYLVTFEQEKLDYGQREDDRSQAREGSGSESRQEEEVPGGQQA